MPAPHPDVDLLTPADAAKILSLSVDMVRVLAKNGQLPTAAKTIRGARLFRRDDVEELAAARAGRPVRHHSVQFYERDDHLVEVVAGFLADGLRGGGAAICIAPEPFRERFLAHLRAHPEIACEDAIASGQLVLFDARETVSQFFLEGRPDADRFRECVGPLFERSHRDWPRARVRAYASMVDLLVQEGRRDEALQLEEMWNGLAARLPFSLLCAYSMAHFPGGSDTELFDRICGAHTRVVPTESFHQDGGIDHRHLEIARLQQRARALQTELAERVRTERTLRKAKDDLDGYSRQLGEALHAKDEILAMLGHELRNPLAPMLSAVELLRRRGIDTREHEVIARQVRHLHRLVEDLLDVGRLVRGKVTLQRRAAALAEVVRRSVELSGERLEHRSGDLDLRLPRENVTVNVDLERMAQAIANLLRNAAQHSEPGSRIVVEAESSESSVRLFVRDFGAGISPELLPRVFDLFEQHSQPIDRSRGGLGIGLAITRNIVELHGGTVSAHSAGHGTGSEFVVKLPLLTARPAADSPLRDAKSITGSRRRVLIVDDNEDAADMLAALLAEYGHTVETAHAADAALVVARTFDPELALLDIGLPRVDGFELARRLRTLNSSLRLVAVSGYGDGANRTRSSEAGFEAHLIKPVRIEDVLKLLEFDGGNGRMNAPLSPSR